MRVKAYALARALILPLIAGLLAGCAGRPASTARSEEQLVIYTTIYPLYDFAVKLVGERGTVRLLLPPGGDAHSWEPGVEALRSLQEADLLIYNGAGLEPWVSKVVAAVGNSRLVLVEASRGVTLLPVGEVAEPVRGRAVPGDGPGAFSAGAYDPHVWLDPLRARQQAANILEGLGAADPEGREYYAARYRVLARRLEQLDFLYRTVLAGRRSGTLVVSHAAFGYLASRYGLEQVALTGAHAEAEPGPQELAQVVALARQQGLKYVFADEMHGQRVAQAVARELGAELVTLHSLASLTPEQLAAGEDYFSLMEDNLVRLRRGLE